MDWHIWFCWNCFESLQIPFASPCKGWPCSHARSWVEEIPFTCVCSSFYLISPPRKYPIYQKNIAVPRPWAAPVTQLCATLNKSSRYNTTSPSPGRGSPGPGVASGRATRSLSRKPLGPTPTGNQLHPSPAPPVQPARPCAADPEQRSPAHPQTAAPQAPMRHWPIAPLDPRPNTKESSLQSISPMFGSAVQECAMASVTQGRKSCSCLPVDRSLLLRFRSTRHEAGITGVPGTCMTLILYYWPGKFG